jgi:hypothetical protein
MADAVWVIAQALIGLLWSLVIVRFIFLIRERRVDHDMGVAGLAMGLSESVFYAWLVGWKLATKPTFQNWVGLWASTGRSLVHVIIIQVLLLQAWPLRRSKGG